MLVRHLRTGVDEQICEAMACETDYPTEAELELAIVAIIRVAKEPAETRKSRNLLMSCMTPGRPRYALAALHHYGPNFISFGSGRRSIKPSAKDRPSRATRSIQSSFQA